ncbi:hypothetical protein ACIRF8_31975 [Streptomyces sp. NPDC102406]|uniref:hypothetical protein n=1 Tax=Streptomyces sp. NPDC102406 TaxID=3366171 RepID=UPI00381F2E4B
MDINHWFEVEDPRGYGEEPWDFDEAERAFLSALRSRAAGWRGPWAPSNVSRPEDDSSLLVRVSLLDDRHSVILSQWAVHFYGTHVRAGKVCDQLFNLHEAPEHGFLQVSGTAEGLARKCVDWFETRLRRPAVRSDRRASAGPRAAR